MGLKARIVNKLFPSFTGLCPGAGTQGLCTGQGGMQNFGQSGYSDAVADPQSPSYTANMTWVKNNHTFKTGADWRTEGYISNANRTLPDRMCSATRRPVCRT